MRTSRKKRLSRRWTLVDQQAAAQITRVTSTPGIVFPLNVSAVPQAIQQMAGVVSYFVSGYTTQYHVQQGITAGGELALVRTEGSSTKAYNYIFATSSNGQIYFNGPYKEFKGHHFDTSAAISVSSLFGHGPFKNH